MENDILLFTYFLVSLQEFENECILLSFLLSSGIEPVLLIWGKHKIYSFFYCAREQRCQLSRLRITKKWKKINKIVLCWRKGEQKKTKIISKSICTSGKTMFPLCIKMMHAIDRWNDIVTKSTSNFSHSCYLTILFFISNLPLEFCTYVMQNPFFFFFTFFSCVGCH